MSEPTPIIEMRGITKRFGGVTALRDVDLTAYAGEVLAIVGDNGAGKSTLIKIITGVHRADTGTVTLDGEEVHFSSPRDAIARGSNDVAHRGD